jgi:hypothetical protein
MTVLLHNLLNVQMTKALERIDDDTPLIHVPTGTVIICDFLNLQPNRWLDDTV